MCPENDIYLYYVYRFIANRMITGTCIRRMIHICIMFTDSSQTGWQLTHLSGEWYIFVLCYRFIPNRVTTDMECGHHRLMYPENDDILDDDISPSKVEYQRAVSEVLGSVQSESKILSFKNKPPPVKEGQ